MKTARAFLFSMMCLAPALPLLGEAPEWENEEVTGINKEVPVPPFSRRQTKR